ncbi:UNVERIFIED_CONTAM: putative mitochondrial adenine nucleotide transporter BTL3 [Sesamum angustifolium]|uniref:Mitochondrial adenine nucleotide transporter BTL3 n=1 Tax=Sesamum angustifolium TaxID=2727405 RepID=A0AAW2J790_9LAMI
MTPSGAVFYGVYDILKSAYLHSPEGRERLQHMKQQGDELNALEQMELGPIRTLIYGAIAGACSEAATYPFEVVRRQLQMQVRATQMGALQTCLKIVEQGGIPALYAGLVPSLLQILKTAAEPTTPLTKEPLISSSRCIPSAAISYLVYEFMKIVLKVE